MKKIKLRSKLTERSLRELNGREINLKIISRHQRGKKKFKRKKNVIQKQIKGGIKKYIQNIDIKNVQIN